MLTYTVREEDGGAAIHLELAGRTVCAREMRWVVDRWVPDGKILGRGEWDFAAQTLQVVEARMPQELILVMNRVFGERLRALDAPRQEGIFEGACSVCGNDRNTFPETAVRDGHGNIMETCGSLWVSPDTPIGWRCHVCDRLVCRRCILTIPGSLPWLGDECYATTYCSLACRAAASPEMLHTDEVMR